MHVLIVDDEYLARQRLRRFLEQQDDISEIAEAENARAALQYLETKTPDLVLLDIQMPGMNGLECASQIMQSSSPPAIIFCTAYDEYALDAFRVNAANYLMKPVRLKDLEQALKQCRTITRAQLVETDRGSSYFCSRSHRGIEKVRVADIILFRAEQKYVVAVTEEKQWVLDETLKTIESGLSEEFIRIHRSMLVSADRIQSLRKEADGYQVVIGGVEKPQKVSRRHVQDVKKKLQHSEQGN